MLMKLGKLTPWCRVLLEKLTGLQLVKKFRAFYGTRRFITALASVRHLSLSWASPIQSTYPQSHKTTNQIMRRLQIFVYKCLRRIMNVKWTVKIMNEGLWRITHQKLMENRIKRRKWNWIGHTLRNETGAIEKTALDWNPQGYRRRGRPKRTWRRTMEDEIRSTRR